MSHRERVESLQRLETDLPRLMVESDEATFMKIFLRRVDEIEAGTSSLHTTRNTSAAVSAGCSRHAAWRCQGEGVRTRCSCRRLFRTRLKFARIHQ